MEGRGHWREGIIGGKGSVIGRKGSLEGRGHWRGEGLLKGRWHWKEGVIGGKRSLEGRGHWNEWVIGGGKGYWREGVIGGKGSLEEGEKGGKNFISTHLLLQLQHHCTTTCARGLYYNMY